MDPAAGRAGLAFTLAGAAVYGLVRAGVLRVDGQGQGILTVLVFGAGTDYALLLIARYREELHAHERAWDAMRVALRGAVPTIAASAATVVLGLLCPRPAPRRRWSTSTCRRRRSATASSSSR